MAMKLRYIHSQSGVRYLRVDDAVALLRELASREAPDARNRINALADTLTEKARSVCAG